MGDVEQRLHRAATLIEERVGSIVRQSSMHRSKAWGFTSDAEFTNAAYVVETPLSAEEALEVLLKIEAELGRDRRAEYRAKALSGESFASRIIDLDIAMYDEQLIVEPHLTIPHIALLHRDFFIATICEALGCDRATLIEKVTEIINAKSE